MVLVVAGDASTPVSITISCPLGTYGRPGDRCARCPDGAVCRGRDTDPAAMAGYYPLALAQFVPCTPAAACVGGVTAAEAAVGNSTALGCSRNYAGQRCAQCGVGAYRLKGRCASCPNTAWLLFLLFSAVAVVGAVYLSKKRINMAGLSVGVLS